MHPPIHAKANPDKPAYIMGAHRRDRDLRRARRALEPGRAPVPLAGHRQAGDSIALFMDNTPRYYEVLWAAQRSGLRFTAISSKLTAGEVEYIVKDCEAKALVAPPAWPTWR